MLRLSKARRIKNSLLRFKSFQSPHNPNPTRQPNRKNKTLKLKSEFSDIIEKIDHQNPNSETTNPNPDFIASLNQIKESEFEMDQQSNKNYAINQDFKHSVSFAAPIYENLYHEVERETKIQDNLNSQTMQEMINLYEKDHRIQSRFANFERTLRNSLFTTTNFQKFALKEYLKHSKKTGHNEYLLESLFRHMSIYMELKGELTQRGTDVFGPEFWNSTLFVDISRDLGYLTLPGIELDSKCLQSLFDSFARLKYKDHRILGPLSLKLVLGVREPDDSILYHKSNEFSFFNIREFIDKSILFLF